MINATTSMSFVTLFEIFSLITTLFRSLFHYLVQSLRVFVVLWYIWLHFHPYQAPQRLTSHFRWDHSRPHSNLLGQFLIPSFQCLSFLLMDAVLGHRKLTTGANRLNVFAVSRQMASNWFINNRYFPAKGIEYYIRWVR